MCSLSAGVHMISKFFDVKMQAWQEEGERARLGQRDAEAKLSSMEASLLCFVFSKLQFFLSSPIGGKLPWSGLKLQIFQWHIALSLVYWIIIKLILNCWKLRYENLFAMFLYLLQAEVQKMRVEMAAMKRDAEHYSRQVMFWFCAFSFSIFIL